MADFLASLVEWFADHVGAGITVGVLFLVAPFLLSRFVVGASWLQIACAFAIFFIILALLLTGGKSARVEEVFGFTLIFGMFSAWLGVPLVSLVLKLANVPGRLL